MRALDSDLEEAMVRAEEDLRALHDQHILVTGGTGFVGRWLLTTLMHAVRRLHLNLSVTSLSRNPRIFADREPELASWCQLVSGDVREPIGIDAVDRIIHAATPASADLNDRAPDEMRDIIVAGMENVLELAQRCGAQTMFTSSGAVYGPQPLALACLPEDYEPPHAVRLSLKGYPRGKRDAEELARTASADVTIARLFSFVGPHLPMDTHFAIGNFIRDAVEGRSIRVAGDGTAIRSYMYASDLAVALLAILVRGEPRRPYNVGSESAVSIRDLAETVRDVVSPDAAIEIAGLAPDQLPGSAGSRYVPDTSRASTELAVECVTPLETSIARTAEWAIGTPWPQRR